MTKGEWIGLAFLVFILGGTVVMAAVMAKVMHLTPEIVAKIYDLEMPGCTDNGHFDKAAMKDLYDTLIAPKLEGKQIEVSSLYTEAFLPK